MNLQSEIESVWEALVEDGYPVLHIGEMEKHVSPKGEDITYCRIFFKHNNRQYDLMVSAKYDIKAQLSEYLERCRIKYK